jgi:cell division transport system ATP-binding protein
MIHLQNLTIAHRGLPIVSEVDLSIGRGEVVILTGETGSGKTSLIRAIYGDLRPSIGKIVIDGLDITAASPGRLPALRRRMGLIFQDDKLLEDRTVYDNIRFALSIQMRSSREIKRKALEILAELGLSHLRSMMPRELSGGEAQRIGVARALANGPSMVLADEPTGDLDAATTTEIFRYIAMKSSNDATMLISTHDPEPAFEVFPRARHWHLQRGEVREL